MSRDAKERKIQARAPSARLAALQILLSTEQAGVLTEELLERFIDQSKLDDRDRALVVQLVHGVHRYRGTLDWRVQCVCDRRLSRLPAIVLECLRLGAYQLLYMDKVPASAAVNESVRLVKTAGRKLGHDWSGFTNAVLRSLERAPAPPWPDIACDPVKALAVRYSCPVWLVERWIQRYGVAQAQDIARATLNPPPLTLRVNTLRISRAGFLEACKTAGCTVRPTEVSPDGVSLLERRPIPSVPLFAEGGFYVEDEAAQLVPLLLDPQPGERLLDACAAPGGKTTHLAALMNNRGKIVAVDRSKERVRLVEENCARLNISIVTPIAADVMNEWADIIAAGSSGTRGASRAVTEERFDGILLDAPCSGLGILRRHPEGKWHKQAAVLAHHHEIQYRLLEQVCRLLRPGGRVVYSTCSTEPEENEQVIERFCRTHREFHREPVGSLLSPAAPPLITPHGDLSTMGNALCMDGFYAARLRRDKER